MKLRTSNKFSAMILAAFVPSLVHAAQIDVIATQTVNTTPFGANVRAITTNTTWTKDNVYILTDKVFVTNGATLTIQPGTKIYSTLDDKGTSLKDDDAFGSIVIVRGAKINAAGTAAEPIVMTTIDELEAETQLDSIDVGTTIAVAPTPTTAGRWGGLVVLGNAPVANYSGTTNIGEDRIEGFQPAASADLDSDTRADVIEYGGNQSTDNSGVISYLSIRHGGYVFNATNGSEINGLTLGGVGSGTVINHVEVYANADDGIEFFGGTVNTNNIVLAFNQDDGFDIDQGYSGTNQFWFAIQAPKLEDGVTSAHDNGGEWDGVTGTIADNSNNSAPIIYNATFIGSGTTGLLGNDKGNNAIFLDDRFKGKVYNSVFDDFSEDLIESAGDGFGAGLSFAHNTIGRFGTGAYTGSNASNLSFINGAAAANTFFDSTGSPINGNSNGGVNPMYRSYTRNVELELTSIDPRPAHGSPLLSSSVQSGAPINVSYRGAFGSVNWAAGWTQISASGVMLGESVTASPIADTDGDGISDAVETANSALGLNPAANDATAVLATLKTAAQFASNFTDGQNSVTSNPSAFSLYTATSIQNLRGTGMMIGPVTPGSSATVTLPLFSSPDLTTWTAAGNVTGTVTTPPGKQFFRVDLSTNSPNP
jgi:trimeric autotransporter adhesin